MHKLRILVAHDLCFYREVIADAFAALNPLVEVSVVEPEDLASELERVAPHLVICSQASAAVRSSVPSWVELYPGHGRLSHVSVGGKISTVSEMDLEHLFSIVDQTHLLTRTA